MKTLYIDVYFFINFTVDILSLYFAAVFSKVPTSARRLIFAAFLGALSACVTVLFANVLAVKFFASLFTLLLMGIVGTKRVKTVRRVKFIFSFFIFSALVGSGVYFLWGLLDTYIYEHVDSLAGATVNRKVLLLALAVLLSIGVFKMFVSLFSNNQSERSVELEISFFDKKIRAYAFVDTGNLAIDPMDMRPVLLIKKSLAKELLPGSVIELTDPDLIDRDVRKRIRLIPVTRGGETHVLTGVRADCVRLISDEKNEEISVNIAVDKEGGSFGGFDILIPSSAIL